MTDAPQKVALPRHSPLFGFVAPQVGWVPPLRFLLRRRRIMRLLSSLTRGRLVEVGCGAGALLAEFGDMGFEPVGVESSPRAMERAMALVKAIGGRYEILAAPREHWDQAFDLLCAFDVLEHIKDDTVALDEWISWLRPGGVVCLSVPAHQSRWSEGDEWAGHYRRYDRSELQHMFESRGFRIQHLECYGFPLANLTEFFGRRTYRRLLKDRSGVSREQATEGSGIDHRNSMRLFRWLDTVPGRLALRCSYLFQAIFSKTDMGSGYLLLAEKK